ncbi:MULTISPECIES: sensor histidine kinase [Clostridium]|uniref:histidine kinase n=1 Tax=Clostridium nitritogenes TaxID=83340 RepID=A0ABP3WU99_9CLOT|nr:HAMP domain-containing sensor histidine kinase [Clostridium baratii]KJU71177.1 histidine kinase [Clostridium baratii]MDY3207403.1 HAMP domain-containing sensor histidine kinase [Clostridium baratii]STA98957.1 integral membrane sensor signal transduction histidine kinase [Clostridium baratii]
MKNKKDDKDKVKFKTRISNRLLNNKLARVLKKYYYYIEEKVKKSIRFELVIIFGLCFAVSALSYIFMNDLFRNEKTNAEIRYDYSRIERKAQQVVDDIEESKKAKGFNINDSKAFARVFDSTGTSDKIYITDIDGKVIHRNQNASEEKIDIFNTLKNVSRNMKSEVDGSEYTIIYPLDINNGKYYLIYNGIPPAEIEYVKYEVSNSFLALSLSIIMFIIIFLLATNKKTKYLDEIAKGIKIIAEGDLSYNIPVKGNDEITNIAINVNNMADEISNRINAQKISEQTKADLITNVSHDLRTPLTSIMGYIGLVKDKKYGDEKTRDEYLNIAYNKSEKLKALIEDLFEYTKLNNNGMKLNKAEVNLVDFVSQVSEEMRPYFEENNIDQIKTLTDQKIIASIDTGKMVRVIENLLTNAVKYSYKPGAVIIGVYVKDGYATIAVKNRGENIPQAKLDKLFDRFYRLDESRSAELGGSGLGLAISKNIVEMHGGKIWGECYGNDISFYIRLKV